MFLHTISWKVRVIKSIVYWAIMMKVWDIYFSFLEEVFKHVFGLYLEPSACEPDLRSASCPCALDVPTVSLSHHFHWWVCHHNISSNHPPLPHDVGLNAVLDITFSELLQWYRVALHSFSAVHPSSALFYNKNSCSWIFTYVLLTYCEMCWQWCIKYKNSWK